MENRPEIDWVQAVHPLLYLSLQKQNRQVVPLDIALNQENRILIISGPNAGGKSVCLKTVGLLQYMVQCGLLLPLKENSRVGIFSDIFIDIGDEQSIENDLSTYSSHLLNMKFFSKTAMHIRCFSSMSLVAEQSHRLVLPLPKPCWINSTGSNRLVSSQPTTAILSNTPASIRA